jgi:hypothetical protein
MAPLYTLACVDEGGGMRVLSPIGASTGPQLCGEIGRQLGLSSDATFEYWDNDFRTWVPIHLELLDMPKRARIQVSLRVDGGPCALVGAPATMSTVADERPLEMETDAVCLPTPAPWESLVRDHPDVPKKWVASAEELRLREKGSFVILKLLATEEEKDSQPENDDATIKILCLDCRSSKPIATGGGRNSGGCSLWNFENSHLKGPLHKKSAGTLGKYDAIVEAGPVEGEPGYFCFVRDLNLRRGEDDAQFAVSLLT